MNKIISFYIETRKKFIRSFFIDTQDEELVMNIRPFMNSLFLAITICGLLSIFMLLIDLAFLLRSRNPINISHLGTFGDFFGGTLNPIMSLLTLAGLVVTIILQKLALKKSHIEYMQTSKDSKIQSIENTFFNMISLHNNIVDSLKLEMKEISNIINEKDFTYINKFKDQSFSGRAVFDAVYNVVIHVGDPLCNCLQKKTYKTIQTEYNYILGHYFRNLYQILNFIDNCDLTFQTKKKLTNILRAQISTSELAVLLINCIDDMVDNGEFRALLIKYAFLEHIPLKLTTNNSVSVSGSKLPLVNIETMRQYMPSENRNAFGSNPFNMEMKDIIGAFTEQVAKSKTKTVQWLSSSNL